MACCHCMAGSPKIVISNRHRFPKQPNLNNVNLGDDSSSCSLPRTKGTRVHTSSACSNTSRKQSVCILPYLLHSQMTCLHLMRWAQRWMDKSLAFAKFCPGQGIPSKSLKPRKRECRHVRKATLLSCGGSFAPEMTEGYAACLKHCA